MKRIGPAAAVLCMALAFSVSAGASEVVSSEPGEIGGGAPGYEGSGELSDDAGAGEVSLPDMSPQPCHFGGLVGLHVNAVNRAQFGKRPVRFLHKGDMVTTDFSPARINVMLDEKDKVISVTCG